MAEENTLCPMIWAKPRPAPKPTSPPKIKPPKTLMCPSCHTKLPKRENIEIFDTIEAGLSNGYLPCQKCCPDKPDWAGVKRELVQSAKALLEENLADKFSLQELAERLYVDKSYLARTFKEITGVTMLEYHDRLRCERSKEYLRDTGCDLAYISSVIGYSSSSHYIRTFKKYCGCTPKEYRKERGDP